MNRFARIMQFLGWVGVAALFANWVHGFLVQDDTPRLLQHTSIGLVAACLCILPRIWTMAYLLLAARGRTALRRETGARSGQFESLTMREGSSRLRRWALFGSATALVGLAGSFALAGAVLLRQVSPMMHASTGFGALALQIVALLLERRALLADAAEMREMAGSPVAGAASLPPRVADTSFGAS